MPEDRVTTVTERTCWRRELAHRLAFLVDGENYFEAVAAALRAAKHSVLIVGWDIHSKFALRPQSPDDPCVLVELLEEITRRNTALDVRVLIWDPSPVFAFEREFLPLPRLSFGARHRLHLALASDHPPGGTHHQKIVVIDDAIAFVGGLDLTINRWDNREHRERDPLRALPNGELYAPFHDVQLAVDGEAAVAMGTLARERWYGATGKRLSPPRTGSDPWPELLVPELREVQVGFARTQPAWKETPQAREVEALFVQGLASARRCIYLENQYITSSAIRDALCKRLRETDGPEVILLTPGEQSSGLERLTMGVLRTRVLSALRDADVHGRLRLMCPAVGVGENKTWVHVHSKVMAIDDTLLVIGSANLCNRSMSLDTECNAAIESPGGDATARAIRAFRDGLLAEHLGLSTSVVSLTIEELGSVRAAIDRLKGGPHTLMPLTVEVETMQVLAPLAEVVDAVGPVDEELVRRAMPDEAIHVSRRKLPRVVTLLVGALALAAAWTWTPLREWARPSELLDLAAPLRDHVWGPILWVPVFALISLTLFPVTLLVIVSVMLFGTWLGFITAMAGSLLGSAAAWGLGRALLGDTVRRLAGKRLDKLAHNMASRGWLAIVAVRMVPLAPFAIVNLVAGSARIRLRDFLIGTLLGMAPGILGLALAADSVVAAAKDPSPGRIGIALSVVVVAVSAMLGLARLLERARSGTAHRPSNAT